MLSKAIKDISRLYVLFPEIEEISITKTNSIYITIPDFIGTTTRLFSHEDSAKLMEWLKTKKKEREERKPPQY